MKLSTLQNKLQKMQIETKELDYNGYNKALIFTVNDTELHASFNEGEDLIDVFSTDLYYDQADQETKRLFFSNFKRAVDFTERRKN